LAEINQIKMQQQQRQILRNQQAHTSRIWVANEIENDEKPKAKWGCECLYIC